MLDRTQCIALFANSSPAVREESERVRDDWKPDDVPLTIMMGAIGRVLGRTAPQLSEEDAVRIAENIERALSEGDEITVTAVFTGLLESLVNQPGAIRLIEHLGPKARAHCKAWDEFTGVKTPGLRD